MLPPCSDLVPLCAPQVPLHLVYCPTCTANRRYYFGVTCRAPQARFKEHSRAPPWRMRGDARRHRPFESNFQLQVLAGASSKEDAELLEAFFIWKFDATGPSGYNASRSASEAVCLPRPGGRRRSQRAGF